MASKLVLAISWELWVEGRSSQKSGMERVVPLRVGLSMAAWLLCSLVDEFPKQTA